MVEGMSVVVNVMVSLMSVMSPPPVAHFCEVMYFGCCDFRGELGFLNCDDICMCIVNKQFELLGFVFDSVYVDLQYDEISLTFTAGYVCLCGVCNHVVVLDRSVRLLWYPMLWMGCFGDCYLLLVVTCGCSAASNWKPGPHAVSTIVKCFQSPGCC